MKQKHPWSTTLSQIESTCHCGIPVVHLTPEARPRREKPAAPAAAPDMLDEFG